jgi:two-component system, OmpR family, response regulator MprA
MTRVLIADDSETILLLLRTRLEMEGYEVVTAVDGAEVMEKLGGDEAQPDVILLDAMMPRKSGLDVLRELRDGGSETPILIVSAHQEQEAVGDASGQGADGYVRKPIDFDELLGRIRELTSA